MSRKNSEPKEKTTFPTLVVTKYMGSKKAILDFVASELTRLTQTGDILVDLMAGTHTIGYAMKNRCRIIANDIQRFSRVIGETLLNYDPEHRFEGVIRDTFRRFYLANLRHLEDLFQAGLRQEKAMLTNEIGRRPTWISYRDFCEGYPYYSYPNPISDWPEDFLLLFGNRRVEAYRTLNKLEPYSLFSLYYANSYLGVHQAAEIDSLRYAIDKLCDQWLPDQEDIKIDTNGLRCLLLSALISVLNRINPGPGHWAAFPRVSQRNRDWLVSQRSIPLWALFTKKVGEFEKSLAQNSSSNAPHILMTEDYANFMEEVHEYIRQAKVVYLDPPYSQGHYSRFYHLIETLVLYDYPAIGYMGRYRNDRHQSPFAHKEKVAESIGQICRIAREGGAILVVSYSRGGIITDAETFRAILERYYPSSNITLKTLDSVHSKLGKTERMKTVEYLFTCQP